MFFEVEGPTPPPDEDSIPDKCLGCPVQCDFASRMAVLKRNKSLASAIGNAMVGEEEDALFFDSLVDDEVPPEDAEDVKLTARQQISRSMDEIDAEIEELQSEIDANADVCIGIVPVTGARNGIEYAASLCTSRLQYEIDSERPNHVPAHVLAKRIQEES